MNGTKSLILSIVLAFNAYYVQSQARIIHSDSGVLSLVITNANEPIYEHKISNLYGFDLIDYSIADSMISVIYIPKIETRHHFKDLIFISLYKMIEKDELYIQTLNISSYQIAFDDEQDLSIQFPQVNHINVMNKRTKEKARIEFDLIQEKCIVYNNDNLTNPETVNWLKTKQFLVNKEGKTINP